MQPIIWILISFFAGSIPTSVWLGRIFLGKDIRQYGDGNPGATNVFRAGNPVLGVTSLLLDVCKAALPVGICYANLNIRGLPMLIISIAPVLGHAFSPFLRFKGGKALAAALGVWIGLTIWTLPIAAVSGVILGVIFLINSGWATMFAMMLILISMLVSQQDGLIYGIWLAQTLILAWTHRADLATPLTLHPSIISRFTRGER